MTLIDKIETDLVSALKSQQKDEVMVLRLIKNALNNAKINNNQQELNEEQVITVIKKQAKDRNEAIEMYKTGNKPDMVAKEQVELDILQKYLPAEMTDDQLLPLIDQAITEVNPNGLTDFGKVMGNIMPKVKGQVDGARLSKLIKEKLA